MTPAQISAATGSTLLRAAQWLPHLVEAAARWGIDTPRRQALWLAQIGVESAALSTLEENLNYSAQRLTEVWPKRFPTLAAAAPFARNPQALAERTYGGRFGNRPEGSGDGWRYRGRGLKQLTFHDNYAAYKAASGRDVVTAPEQLTVPAIAADSAGWYWAKERCNELADAGNIAMLTRAINGGLNGFEQRKALSARGLRAFGVTA